MLDAAWTIYNTTGCTLILIVCDCSPAVKALKKAYSDKEEMRRILDSRLVDLAENGVSIVAVSEKRVRMGAVDILARGQVETASARLRRDHGWSLSSRITRH